MAHTKLRRALLLLEIIWILLCQTLAMIKAAEKGGDSCLCLEEVASEMKGPLYLTSPDDDTDRLFITTQEGVIYIHAMDGTPNDQPFLNLTERVTIEGGYHNGMVGMTFHPEFKTNRKFYVTYTYLDMDGSDLYRLSEFTASSEDDNIGEPDSERILISLKKPSELHHAGQLFFGIDTYLYMFIGDGGPEMDPNDNAQNRSNLFGSILRIDVNTQDDPLPYGIPADNPFVNEDGVRPEIFAYGFRNPFRGGQDKGDSDTGAGAGRIFCGDAGRFSYEEINLVKAGHNYGWNFREGEDCVNDAICGAASAGGVDYLGTLEEFPIYTYNRTGQVAAVIGGMMYRGCRNPELNGLYFYSDIAIGSVSALKEHTVGVDYWENLELGICPVNECPEGMKGSPGMFTRSFGEDSHGELYLLTSDSFDTVDPVGKVHRLVDPRKHGDLKKCWIADETSGSEGIIFRNTKLYLYTCLMFCILMLGNTFGH